MQLNDIQINIYYNRRMNTHRLFIHVLQLGYLYTYINKDVITTLDVYIFPNYGISTYIATKGCMYILLHVLGYSYT